MSAGSALAGLLRSAARLDRTQSDPAVSLRNAVGVAAPLALAALAGSAAAGLPSTVGALQTAFADRPGPYRLRLMRMLTTAAAAGLTSGLAVLASGSVTGSVLLLLVLGFGTGLLLSAGPSATQVGVAATAAALIIGHRHEPASAALQVGLLILAGGVLQTVLAIAAWPLRRHRPERVALAGLYRDLAAAATSPPHTDTGPPVSEPLGSVRATLYGLGHDHGPSVEAYRVLLDEAARIRRELIVLAGHAERLDAADSPDAARAIRAILAGCAEVLDEIAGALTDARPVDPSALDPVRIRIKRSVALLDDPPEDGGALTSRAAASRVRSLAGQLRAAIETARTGASEGGTGEEPDTYGVRRLRAPLAIVRANLTPDSAVFRHAVRVGVLVAASDLAVRLLHTERGYWVPLTILVVLRPDFGSTFQRSIMRMAGTIVGLFVATELVHWIPGGDGYLIALVAVFFFGMRFAGPGNLGLSAVSLAGLVVVLLAIDGVAPHATLVFRAEDTLIGGALALAAMLLSPLWERSVLPDRLGALLAAYRTYLESVIDPETSAARHERVAAATRLARTNARASVDRARAEPVPGRGVIELGEAVLVHSHRFAHAMLTVDAVRHAGYVPHGLPELDELMRLAAAALDACERAVRTGQAPRSVTSLRPAQERLAHVLTAHPERVGGSDVAGALLDASDRIANSLDTLVAELRRQLR